jgi:hypothetical protein
MFTLLILIGLRPVLILRSAKKEKLIDTKRNESQNDVRLCGMPRPRLIICAGPELFAAFFSPRSALRQLKCDRFVSSECEKKWHPEIVDATIALPHFMRWFREHCEP